MSVIEERELKKIQQEQADVNYQQGVEKNQKYCPDDDTREKMEQIIENNLGKPEALLEVLHQAQDLIGFIPREVQKMISEGLNISAGEVAGVISFYSHFSDVPKGKYQIALCKGTACYVKGSAEIIRKIEEKYGVSSGETTEDGLFSLEVVRCLGACGLSPVMTVNGKAHGLLNPEKAVKILEEYKKAEL